MSIGAPGLPSAPGKLQTTGLVLFLRNAAISQSPAFFGGWKAMTPQLPEGDEYPGNLEARSGITVGLSRFRPSYLARSSTVKILSPGLLHLPSLDLAPSSNLSWKPTLPLIIV